MALSDPLICSHRVYHASELVHLYSSCTQTWLWFPISLSGSVKYLRAHSRESYDTEWVSWSFVTLSPTYSPDTSLIIFISTGLPALPSCAWCRF